MNLIVRPCSVRSATLKARLPSFLAQHPPSLVHVILVGAHDAVQLEPLGSPGTTILGVMSVGVVLVTVRLADSKAVVEMNKYVGEEEDDAGDREENEDV